MISERASPFEGSADRADSEAHAVVGFRANGRTH
jgi:hypothetical protein